MLKSNVPSLKATVVVQRTQVSEECFWTSYWVVPCCKREWMKQSSTDFPAGCVLTNNRYGSSMHVNGCCNWVFCSPVGANPADASKVLLSAQQSCNVLVGHTWHWVFSCLLTEIANQPLTWEQLSARRYIDVVKSLISFALHQSIGSNHMVLSKKFKATL